MRVPEGWTGLSPYCCERDGYTICAVGKGDSEGKTIWVIELWRGKEQLIVNLQRITDAVTAFERIANGKSAAPPH